MLKTRVIPVLLLKDKGLVKTVKFNNPTYIGDPINAVKIFNDKEVDELIFLDIDAARQNRPPLLETISEITNECFMPLCYGGGVRTVDQMKKIFSLGVEKVALNSAAVENPSLVREAARIFGSQSVIVSIDVKKNFWGKEEVVFFGGKKKTGFDPANFAKQMQEFGAGEIMLNSVDRDGTFQGYDLDLIKKVCESIDIPVIACGGAAGLEDFSAAVEAGASAVSAGSFFVFYGKNRAVLINYPTAKELESILN